MIVAEYYAVMTEAYYGGIPSYDVRNMILYAQKDRRMTDVEREHDGHNWSLHKHKATLGALVDCRKQEIRRSLERPRAPQKQSRIIDSTTKA